MKSPPNDDFRFYNFVLLNQKLKKQKWQCSQNLDLNPTCVKEHNDIHICMISFETRYVEN